MRMANIPLSDSLRAELQRLALLPDEQIDTSDIPEVSDWSNARTAAFYEGPLETRRYDIRAIANWFLDKLQSKGIGVSNLSLNKILYFAVERSLIERNILLTPARMEAWDHGPVFREVYHAFSKSEANTIRSRINAYSIPHRGMIEAKEDFQKEDLDFLESIADTYGTKSPSWLRGVSHQRQGPWDTVWHYKGRINPGMEISPEIILRKAPLRRQIDE